MSCRDEVCNFEGIAPWHRKFTVQCIHGSNTSRTYLLPQTDGMDSIRRVPRGVGIEHILHFPECRGQRHDVILPGTAVDLRGPVHQSMDVAAQVVHRLGIVEVSGDGHVVEKAERQRAIVPGLELFRQPGGFVDGRLVFGDLLALQNFQGQIKVFKIDWV